jgi:hypothetical protein
MICSRKALALQSFAPCLTMRCSSPSGRQVPLQGEWQFARYKSEQALKLQLIVSLSAVSC